MFRYTGIKNGLGPNPTFCIVDTDFTEDILADGAGTSNPMHLSHLSLIDNVVSVYSNRNMNVAANISLTLKYIFKYENYKGGIEKEMTEYIKHYHSSYYSDVQKYMVLI